MVVTLETVDRDAWRQLATSFSDYSYRQLWDFGVACADRVGAVSEHVAIQEGKETIGLADVRVKRIPWLRMGVAYINGGPLVRRRQADDARRLHLSLQALVAEYVASRGLVLRIRPPLGPLEWGARQEETFAESRLDVSKRLVPYRTFLVDLSHSRDTLRRNLARRWRYNLKKAESGNLVVECDSSDDALRRFVEAYRAFIERKGFHVDLGPSFYQAVQGAADDSERFRFVFCKLDGEVVAGHMSSWLGDTAVELFRVTTERALTCHASYLVQWRALCEAQERGYVWYDLGGIDPEGNPGVYHFKKGVGGADITVAGPFEMYPGVLSKTLLTYAERLYQRRRSLRSGR